MIDNAMRQAIVRAAAEEGINPAAALAIAQRESSFNPRARSSKTIRGLFQMRGDLRQQFGVGDSDDPYTQARGWGEFFKGVKRDMAGTLGRDPTDAEAYLGHHFGAKRAARMMGMDPSTPVDAVFTPNEMAQNPHFARAGTVGRLNSSIIADIGRREATFGDAGESAAPLDFSKFGQPVDDVLTSGSQSPQVAQAELPDFSSFGVPVDQTVDSPRTAPSTPDFSSFGTPAETFSPSVQRPQEPESAPDFSQFGVAA